MRDLPPNQSPPNVLPFSNPKLNRLWQKYHGEKSEDTSPFQSDPPPSQGGAPNPSSSPPVDPSRESLRIKSDPPKSPSPSVDCERPLEQINRKEPPQEKPKTRQPKSEIAHENDLDVLEEGWVRLHRKSIRSQVFQNEGLWKIWTWCLMRANHEDAWVPVKIGKGKTEVFVKRGQFIFGRKTAAKELKMRPTTVQDRMQKLENMQNLVTQPVTHYSIITICNYDRYQKTESDDSSPIPSPNRHPTVTNKNDKNKNTLLSDSPNLTGEGLVPTESKGQLEGRESPKKSSSKQPVSWETFERFYSAYPKKKGRKEAKKAWAKLNPSPDLVETILTALEKHKRTEDWQKEKGKYIPYPASWLNGERWMDEVKEVNPSW